MPLAGFKYKDYCCIFLSRLGYLLSSLPLKIAIEGGEVSQSVQLTMYLFYADCFCLSCFFLLDAIT